MKHELALDWVENSELKSQIIDAWRQYEQDSQEHKLYKYFHLLDEAHYEVAPEDFRPWTNDHQPSLKDMW